MVTRIRQRRVALTLLGIAALVVHSWVRDAAGVFVASYLGNVLASFAVFFLVAIALPTRRTHGLSPNRRAEAGRQGERASGRAPTGEAKGGRSGSRSLVGLRRLVWAALALVIVEAFELTNGFGLMTNVYDPFDLLANLAGIIVAYAIDRRTLEA